MPKITRHGGASNAATEAPEKAVQPPTGTEEEGGEGSSPGTSSPASPEKPPTPDETNATTHPRLARTTGSRSRKARTGGHSAGSTGGDQTGEAI